MGDGYDLPDTHDGGVRIMHVVPSLEPGGGSGLVLSLIAALRFRIQFSIFVIDAVAKPSGVALARVQQLQQWHVPLLNRFGGHAADFGGAPMRLRRSIQLTRPHLVHLHLEHAELTFALASLFPGTWPAPVHLRTVYRTTPWKGCRILGRWVAARLAGGDAVAVSSAAARADYGLGARQKRDRAEVIPYGVEPSRVARLAGPRSPFRILFAGGMDQRAGADLLPAIFDKAQSRSGRKDVEVTLCGRGPLERRLREQLRLEVREWRFFFVRSIPHLVDTLFQYDAVLMPSRSEGLSLLPIQVLLARVPLIAARAPGLEDVVTSDYRLTAAIDDVDALADCLVTVLGQDLTFVGSALRARVARRFNITTMARSYEARYRTLAARREGGQG